MSEKRSKYDTDPLDPDFVRRTEEITGGGTTTTATGDVSRERPTERIAPPTERMPPPPPRASNEDPTRRLEDVPRRSAEEPYATSYPSVFVPPAYEPPASYPPHGSAPPQAAQPPRAPYNAMSHKPSSRHVAGLGLPENVSMVLPYMPFYVGMIASLAELLLVPRSEHRTRFHAAQGLALQIAILGISFFFGIVRAVTDSGLGGWLFSLAAFIFLIVSMIRVWNGEEHRIAPLDELTRKINKQFEPRQSK